MVASAFLVLVAVPTLVRTTTVQQPCYNLPTPVFCHRRFQRAETFFVCFILLNFQFFLAETRLVYLLCICCVAWAQLERQYESQPPRLLGLRKMHPGRPDEHSDASAVAAAAAAAAGCLCTRS